MKRLRDDLKLGDLVICERKGFRGWIEKIYPDGKHPYSVTTVNNASELFSGGELKLLDRNIAFWESSKAYATLTQRAAALREELYAIEIAQRTIELSVEDTWTEALGIGQ